MAVVNIIPMCFLRKLHSHSPNNYHKVLSMHWWFGQLLQSVKQQIIWFINLKLLFHKTPNFELASQAGQETDIKPEQLSENMIYNTTNNLYSHYHTNK